MLILHTFACEAGSLKVIYKTVCFSVYHGPCFALTSVKFIIYMWESDDKDLTANLVA